ncbi:rhomboid family intramembrane serine protease [Aquimarina brevivitae]|uniref:Membrane associated rhomboid family serine protease n=1 Tax=Aquimarina brevivitae TaxID=323412 RepID=A0A4Q7PIT8_9FLAO|nr:rhomboid family intramembrane serine protease [Aquimarina brevivitae]RZS99938.1 membrane associated rhomboid family serine protease [Aquimarina brevivitae]
MGKNTDFQFKTGVIGFPILFVLIIWVVFWFEIRFNVDLNTFGIRPRDIVGLRGILFSPFIHSDITHLWHNTLPLFILSSALFFFYWQRAWNILVFGLLCTGILTWIMGRNAYHIGASGLIYMLFGFLFLKGILAKHIRLIALSFATVFVYGSMVWYILPVDPQISWEGHLSGLLVGILLAIVFRKKIAKPKLYDWQRPDYNPEEDEFLQHFDEDGNFIENIPEDEDQQDIQVIYEYKEHNGNKKTDD